MALKAIDGKNLVKDLLIIDAIIYLILLVQYLAIPLINGIIMYDMSFLSVLLGFLIFGCVMGAKYSQYVLVSFLNSFLIFVGFAIYTYAGIYYCGPYNVPMAILNWGLAILHFATWIIVVRSHWKLQLGDQYLVSMFSIIFLAYFLGTYHNFLDLIFSVFIMGIIVYQIKIGVHKIKMKIPSEEKITIGSLSSWISKAISRKAYQDSHFSEEKLRKTKVLGLIFLVLGVGLLGGSTNFGARITVKASDDFKTISSYWGPPSLSKVTVSSPISLIDNYTLQINNVTLAEDPVLYREGALAWVDGITIGSNSTSLVSYADGMESYPNGTVFLSDPLPSISNVNITFTYVTNTKLLEDLNTSHSTLIMNYHGDFIYHDNIFDRIERTYLFQMLDFWGVKFYLDISNGIEFPHIFNYENSVPLGYDTIAWADGRWDTLLGISYDFEPGGQAVPASPPAYPGGTNFTIGNLIGDNPIWERFQREWYHYNEQNQTLLTESTQAYENLYQNVSDRGYKTYITLGLGELYDALDGQIDFTRCPVSPVSPNPDVLYGHMNYQDNNFDQGRYRVYRGCKDQITMLGKQGNTILLGWLAVGTKYYTDDDIGLERYIQDCKIAQAAGMAEIFHAPIYRMQNKWGDEAVLQLHQALNEDPKETIVIDVPPFESNDAFLRDAVENLNYLWMAIPLYILIVVRIGYFGTFKKAKKKSNQ